MVYRIEQDSTLDHIEYVQGEAPLGYKLFFKEDVFLTYRHLELQSEEGWVTFLCLDHNKKAILARFNVNIHHHKAVSPVRSPYGGIEFSSDLSLKLLHDFISHIEKELIKKQVDYIEMKLPPFSYDRERASVLTNALLSMGYSIKTSELDAAIGITEAAFIDIIAPSKRSKLRKGHKGQFRFSEVGYSKWSEVYQFINQCYNSKGYMLSMSYEKFKITLEAFKNSFRFFVINAGDEIIAAAIVIRINDKVSYNFYTCHLRKYDEHNPVMLLLEGIYGYCQQSGIEVMDLGTSALNGTPNRSLLHFKQHVGGVLNLKLIFDKAFN